MCCDKKVMLCLLLDVTAADRSTAGMSLVGKASSTRKGCLMLLLSQMRTYARLLHAHDQVGVMLGLQKGGKRKRSMSM